MMAYVRGKIFKSQMMRQDPFWACFFGDSLQLSLTISLKTRPVVFPKTPFLIYNLKEHKHLKLKLLLYYPPPLLLLKRR